MGVTPRTRSIRIGGTGLGQCIKARRYAWDTSVSPVAYDTVRPILKLPDGRVFAGGSNDLFNNVSESTAVHVSGHTWNILNPDKILYDSVAQSQTVWRAVIYDGNLYVVTTKEMDTINWNGAAGDACTVAAMYDLTAEQWVNFGNFAAARVWGARGLRVFNDGSGEKLFICLDKVGETKGLKTWNGTAIATYEGGITTNYPRDVNWHDDGSGYKMYVGGGYGMTDGATGLVTMHMFGRCTGSSVWEEVGDGLDATKHCVGVEAVPVTDYWGHEWVTGYKQVEVLCQFQGDLYVGGCFNKIDSDGAGTVANSIAKWDGSSLTPLGSGTVGVTGLVHDMVVWKDNLFVCGRFGSAGGIDSTCVARWDGQNWHSVLGGLTRTDTSLAEKQAEPGNCPRVHRMFPDGDDLWLGGRFTGYGPAPTSMGSYANLIRLTSKFE